MNFVEIIHSNNIYFHIFTILIKKHQFTPLISYNIFKKLIKIKIIIKNQINQMILLKKTIQTHSFFMKKTLISISNTNNLKTKFSN